MMAAPPENRPCRESSPVPRTLSADAPVGVFDSGVGGLSVLREIRLALPHEDLLYVADSGHAPYGDQPDEFIEGRASAVVRFLLDAGAKTITIACNTATVVAVEKLRAWSPVPIVAIEPAIKPAAARTRSGVIGVLATRATLASGNVARLVQLHAAGLDVRLQACTGLVQLVEKGELDSPATLELVRRYVGPLLADGADTLVLGCTHYPFLEPAIRAIAGPDVAVIDPAPAVARELHRRLGAAGLLKPGNTPGTNRFYTSGDPARTGEVMSVLWGSTVNPLPFPSSGEASCR